MSNFFAELKRRNVYKVAVAYAVVGWLIAQIATQIFPFLEIPNWVVRLIIVLLAIGFPIALVIAWAFEATPEGIKRTDVADAMSPTPGRKRHAWIYIVVIGAGISVALFFLGRYTVGNKATAATPNELSTKSIAVLPFDSLSEDKNNAFFAEGVQDEILTRLAKVADLKVIARTSTQKFKSAPENLPDIAKQLGALNILEGSVQKVNDQVRVNVQLINALTNAHVWAEIYDRKLTDIFAVESDIAKTIADTLQAKLTGSEKKAISKKPTENPQAYELYLKGRFFWNKRTAADLRKSIDYFKQAIATDPNYALAYVGLSDAWGLLPAYGAASPQDSFPQAKAAIKKALELDDSLGEAHTSAAKTLYDFDQVRAIAEFERSIELNPNYATAHHWFSCGPLQSVGQFDRAIAEGKRAIELDPLSLIDNADLGWVYLNARRYDDAIAQDRKTLDMEPGFYLAREYLGQALILKGQLTNAIAELRKTIELNDDPTALAFLGQALARAGQRKETETILARLTEEAKSRYVSAYNFGLVFLALGDKQRAIDALERSYRDGAANEISYLRADPFLDDLRGDPRFEALMEKIVPARDFKVTNASK